MPCSRPTPEDDLTGRQVEREGDGRGRLPGLTVEALKRRRAAPGSQVHEGPGGPGRGCRRTGWPAWPNSARLCECAADRARPDSARVLSQLAVGPPEPQRHAWQGPAPARPYTPLPGTSRGVLQALLAPLTGIPTPADGRCTLTVVGTDTLRVQLNSALDRTKHHHTAPPASTRSPLLTRRTFVHTFHLWT